MPNGTYGGVRGRKTKVGRKLLRFPPTRLQVPIQGHQIAHFGQSSVTKSLQKNYRLIIVTIFMLTH